MTVLDEIASNLKQRDKELKEEAGQIQKALKALNGGSTPAIRHRRRRSPKTRLSERVRAAIKEMDHGASFTRGELADTFQVPAGAVAWEIRRLVQLGVLEEIGGVPPVFQKVQEVVEPEADRPRSA